MATFSNATRTTTTFSNQSRNSATFTAKSKGDTVKFGSLTFDQIGTLSDDSDYQGIAVGNRTYDDDVSSTNFTNLSRS